MVLALRKKLAQRSFSAMFGRGLETRSQITWLKSLGSKGWNPHTFVVSDRQLPQKTLTPETITQQSFEVHLALFYMYLGLTPYWHDNYNDAPKDGSAWLSAESKWKVLRGGSWYVNPGNCRSASRNPDYARVVRLSTLGFRVVGVLPRTS